MSSEDCPSCQQFGPSGCVFSHPMKSGQKRIRNNEDSDSSSIAKKKARTGGGGGVIPLTGKVVSNVRRWNAHGALYMHTDKSAPPGCICDARTGSRCQQLQVLKQQHEEWWDTDKTPGETPAKSKRSLLKISNKGSSKKINASHQRGAKDGGISEEDDKENKFSQSFLKAFNERRVKSKSHAITHKSSKENNDADKECSVSKEKVKHERESPFKEVKRKSCPSLPTPSKDEGVQDIENERVIPIPEGHVQNVKNKFVKRGYQSFRSSLPKVKEEASDEANSNNGQANATSSPVEANPNDPVSTDDSLIKEEDEKCEQGYYRHLGWFLSLSQLKKICCYKFGVGKEEIQFVEAKRFPFQMYKCREEDHTWKELSNEGFKYTVIYERSPEVGSFNVILYWKKADEETKEKARKSFKFLKKIVTWLEDPEGLEKRVNVSGMGKCDCNGAEYPKSGSASVTLGCTKNSIQRCRYRFTHKKMDPVSRQAAIDGRKWKVKPEFRDKLKAKMEELAGMAERFLYAAAPRAWERMVEHNRKSSCHLFGKEEFPFTSSSLTVDFRWADC
jgi:hypothetical protein